eukprot:1643722-Alexandrium_andersonii.AAC.1
MALGECKVASGIRNLSCAGPGKTYIWSPKLPGGALRAVFRADAESANETSWRANRRRFSG